MASMLVEVCIIAVICAFFVDSVNWKLLEIIAGLAPRRNCCRFSRCLPRVLLLMCTLNGSELATGLAVNHQTNTVLNADNLKTTAYTIKAKRRTGKTEDSLARTVTSGSEKGRNGGGERLHGKRKRCPILTSPG